jgi:Delta7-sterol 5-desaturase
MIIRNNFFLIALFLCLRYFILTGLTYLLFYKIFSLKVVHLKIQQAFPKLKDYVREIIHSLLTILIYAGYGLLIFDADFKKWTKIYDNIHDYSISYLLFSLVLAIFIHDTYFYFMHRALHHRKLFRRVHLVHHKSTNPNPFTAYSFHPSEAIFEGAVILIIVFAIPIHLISFALFMSVSILFNIYAHLGYELIPKRFANSYLGQWINTSKNHNLHHENSINNYGLYFTFWDRIFNTLERKVGK